MTATKQRTDCHRPSVIDPSEYEYVAIEYMKTDISVGDELFLADERRRIEEHRERTGATYSQHQHGGNCHVCGAHAIYTALFHHLPTNTYIRTGFDCADKLQGGDEYAFRQFKLQMKDARARKRGKEKAKLLLEDAGLSEAWPYHGDLAELRDANPNAGNLIFTLADVVRSVVKYGNLSEKQANFIRLLLDKIRRADEIAAQRAAEKAAAEPCPEGRVVITGEVLKTEVRDGYYGTSVKMTVKDDRGFIVWGTVPAALELFIDEEGTQRGLNRGERVTFTAKVTPSDRDDKFGFYSRPTKAERLVS